jgi:hypothetical protein
MELAAGIWFFKGCFVSPLRGRTAVEDLVFASHKTWLHPNLSSACAFLISWRGCLSFEFKWEIGVHYAGLGETEGGFTFSVLWCGDSGLDEGDAQTLLKRLLLEGLRVTRDLRCLTL